MRLLPERLSQTRTRHRCTPICNKSPARRRAAGFLMKLTVTLADLAPSMKVAVRFGVRPLTAWKKYRSGTICQPGITLAS